MISFTYRDGETRSSIVEKRDVPSQSPTRTTVSWALIKNNNNHNNLLLGRGQRAFWGPF